MAAVSRVRERDLVLPALQIIAVHGNQVSGLTVTQITQELRRRMILSAEDRQILEGRKDDRFSQVVRNLVSHRTLEKLGLAEYKRGGLFGIGAYVLTPKGRLIAGENERSQLDLFKAHEDIEMEGRLKK